METESAASPPIDPRDLALGRYLTAWSNLEHSLRFLLARLIGTTFEIGFSVAAAIPDNGRMQELLRALGRLQLDDSDDLNELVEICKHVQDSSHHRNRIVHGTWVVTNDRHEEARSGRAAYMWVRAYPLPDKERERMAITGHSPKDEKKYVYSVARLIERAEKADALGKRIGAFNLRIENRTGKPESST